MYRACATALSCLLLGVGSPAVAQRQARVCNPNVNCRTIDTTYIGDRRYEDYRVTNRNVMVNAPQRRAVLNTNSADAAAACSVNKYAGIQPTLPSLTYTSAALNINANNTNQAANLTLQNVRTSEGYFVPSLNLLINHCHNCSPTVFLTFNQNSNPTLGFPASGLSWMYRSSEPLLPVPNLIGAPVERIPSLSALQPPVQRLLLATTAALPTLFATAGSVNISPSAGLPTWTLQQVVQIATDLNRLIFSTPAQNLTPQVTLTCDVTGVPYSSCQDQDARQLSRFRDLLTFYGSNYLLSGNTNRVVTDTLLSNLRNWAAANALMTYPGYDPTNPAHNDTRIKYSLNTTIMLPLATTWGMLRNDPAVSEGDRTLIDHWTDALLAYGGRPYNQALEVGPNNHGYLIESVAMARAILFGDDAKFAQAVERYYIALNQMNLDGSLPWEVTRDGCSTGYQALAVLNLITIAELAASQGYDLYSLSVHGVTIHTALEFLLNAIANPALINQYAYSFPAGQAVCNLPPGSPQSLDSVVYPSNAFVGRSMTTAFIEAYLARFPETPLSARLRNLPQDGIAAVRPLSREEGGGNATCLWMTDPFVRISLSGPDVIPTAGGTTYLTLTSSLPNFQWTAESSAPWVTLTSASGVGSGTILYEVSPNPAPSQRSATITAGNQVFLVTQLGTQPVPAITPGGIVNAASFTAGVPAAAGSIASIFGSNLASASGAASVRVGGTPAFLFYASPTQINFQVPWEVSGQAQTPLTVTVDGVASTPVTLNLTASSPGIFTTDPAGRGAILIATTGELAAPVGSIPGRASRPANRGVDFITIYCTGLGNVTNRPASGVAAGSNPLSSTTATPTVTIGGVPAIADFSGLTPEFIGLYQINVQVPGNAPVGAAVPVMVSIGNATSNIATIAVQ